MTNAFLIFTFFATPASYPWEEVPPLINWVQTTNQGTTFITVQGSHTAGFYQDVWLPFSTKGSCLYSLEYSIDLRTWYRFSGQEQTCELRSTPQLFILGDGGNKVVRFGAPWEKQCFFRVRED